MKKIAVALAGSAGAVLVLLVGAALIVPQLLDKGALGVKVRHEISSLVDGEFDFDRVDLGFLPVPHVLVSNARVIIPDRFSASVETIELYPDIIASLFGNTTIREVSVVRPRVVIRVPESTRDSGTKRSSLDPSRIMPALVELFTGLPGVLFSVDKGTIRDGSVQLDYNKLQPITFAHLDASIHSASGSVTIEAQATSALFAGLEVSGTLQPTTVAGSMKVHLTKLDLAPISKFALSGSPVRISDGKADVGLTVTLHDREHVELDVACTAPDVRLVGADRAVDLKSLKLAGTAQVGPGSASVSLSEFRLTNPAIRLSGRAVFSDKDPKVSLEVNGSDIDVGSARDTALALAGSNQVAQTVFDILRRGRIPTLTLSGKAARMDGLADLDNLLLKATLTRGTLQIPGTGLTLVEVSGDVDLSKGELAGNKITARWQHSTATEGTLAIDLTKDPLPLSVNSNLDADVADIPVILEMFIKNQGFTEELSNISELSGSAGGTLSLSGDTGQITVKTSAHEINLSARYRDVPFPLELTSGRISYDQDMLSLEKLIGSLGGSTFTSLSGSVDLGDQSTFTITSGKARIIGDELMPWLASQPAIQDITRSYGGGRSVLQLTELEARGSLSELRHAEFRLAGNLQDLTIQKIAGLPGPLKIATLTFRADPQELTFSDLQTDMLDSSLSMSGNYPGYMTGKPRDLSVYLEGKLGPQTLDWVTGQAHLPPWIKLQPLDVGRAQIVYADQGHPQISAALSLQDELQIDTEISVAAGTVSVDSLKIKDQFSDATVTARAEGEHLDLSFAGVLHENTVQKIARVPALKSGSIDGNAHISVNLQDPYDLSLLGTLRTTKVTVPTPTGVTVVVDEISVRGKPGAAVIESADLSFDETRFTLSGEVRPRPGALPAFSLNVEVADLDVDEAMNPLSRRGTSGKSKPATIPFPSHIQGDVRFKVGRLTVHGYTIEPLQAKIVLRDGRANLSLKEATLCGIAMQGTATLTSQNITFHLEPSAHAQRLKTTLDCLVGVQLKGDGTFDMTGIFDGHASLPDMTLPNVVKTVTGQAEINVSDGHVYRDLIVFNLLKFLNVSQVLTGQVTAEQMLEKGVGFDRFQAEIALQDGKLHYNTLTLDGKDFKLAGTGDIDIVEKRLDFILLVAPLKTMNSVLEHVPLLGAVLETIDTIPLGAKGPFDDIHFLPLAPAAVNEQIQDIMKKTLGIPLKLVHLDVFTGQEAHHER